jgi:hypothetical protein
MVTVDILIFMISSIFNRSLTISDAFKIDSHARNSIDRGLLLSCNSAKHISENRLDLLQKTISNYTSKTFQVTTTGFSGWVRIEKTNLGLSIYKLVFIILNSQSRNLYVFDKPGGKLSKTISLDII